MIDWTLILCHTVWQSLGKIFNWKVFGKKQFCYMFMHSKNKVYPWLRDVIFECSQINRFRSSISMEKINFKFKIHLVQKELNFFDQKNQNWVFFIWENSSADILWHVSVLFFAHSWERTKRGKKKWLGICIPILHAKIGNTCTTLHAVAVSPNISTN